MNVKRMLAMVLVFVLVLSMFPGAALASAELGESDAGDDNASQEADSVPKQQSSVDEEPVQAPANLEAEDLPAQAESAPEAVVPSPEKAETDLEADASGEETPAETETETPSPRTELIAQISQGNSRFQLMAPSGTVFSEDAALSARIVEPDDEQMSDICLRYELPGILDYFVFEMSTTGVTHPNETAAVVIDFGSPFLKAISPSAVVVFQYIEGAPVPIPVTATVSDTKETTKMVIEPETRSFNSRYVVMTTDAPADMLEVGTQVAYMAVNTINNKRVGLSGNGISFTTSGIMWHYISDQRKPAICLQPNKTFQTSNAAVYYTEATTVAYSEDGRHMTIGVTDMGLAEINGSSENVNGHVYAGHSNYTMRITYAATINSDNSFIYGDNGNGNKVVLTWKRTSSEYYDTLIDDAHVFSFGIDLTKVFSDKDSAVADKEGLFQKVQFIVQNDTDGYYLKAALNQAEGVYYVTGHTAKKSEAAVFTPVTYNGKPGQIMIKGCEDDTYIISEIKTANGYSLLKNKIKLVISAAADTARPCNIYAQDTLGVLQNDPH